MRKKGKKLRSLPENRGFTNWKPILFRKLVTCNKYRVMLKIIVLWLLTVTPVFASGPQKPSTVLIDSLQNELKFATSDTTKSRLLVSIGNQLSSSDSVGGLKTLKEALKYAFHSSDRYYLANVYAALGRFNQFYDIVDTAKNYYKKAEVLLAKHPPTTRSQKLLLLIKQNELSLRVRENPNEALKEALSLIPLAEKVGDQTTLGNIYNNIGVWFMNISEYEKAIDYFKKSVSVKLVEPRQYARFAYSYVNLAACNYRRGRIDLMPPYLDEAKKNLLKANDRQEVWAWYYNYYGLYAYEKKQYKRAEKDLLNGLSIARKENDALAQSNLLSTLVKISQATGNYLSALKYAKADYQLRLESEGNHLGTLQSLAEINGKLGRYKEAYAAMQTYTALSDSIQAHEKNSNLNEIVQKFETADKERQILQLQHDNEVKSFALQKNRLYTGLLTAVSLLLLTLVILYFQFNRYHKKQLKQHKQLHLLEMEKVGQKNKISLLSAMLDGQESERTRIARDLHDGLGGFLSALKIELSSTFKTEAVDQPFATNTLSRIDYAVDELRFISQNLMPETLIKYGLGEAIKSYCTRMRNKGIQLQCQIFHYSNDLRQEKELILYRIMQELVTNAIKHAQASTIFVQLLKSDNKVTLTIEDNGKGFDKSLLLKNRSGSGLTNIMSRIEYIDGELDIHSEPANGTTFTIECHITS